MKRLFFLFLLPALLLMGCAGILPSGGKQSTGETTIPVLIEEGRGYQVTDNPLSVPQDSDAVFTISLEKGYALLSTSYSGDSLIEETPEGTQVTLKNVHVPTRVSLEVSTRNGQIRYEGNGGMTADGSTYVVKNYSLTQHPRANSALGQDLFSKEGYTLYSWNTKADGSGDRIGLGSRITLSGETLTLYAQYAPWTSSDLFTWEEENGEIYITGYTGDESLLVIPAFIHDLPVKTICKNAFAGCNAAHILLPPGLRTIEEDAFCYASFITLTLFDDLEAFSDKSFSGSENLTTLFINAAEAPFGYDFRKESVYADKVDLLILAAHKKKMVFYGGCSMWYNLIPYPVLEQFGDDYTLINMGLNGTVNSAVQLQILSSFLEEGDIFFHTPELSSKTQLMLQTDMTDDDSSLWCGLENNYDLFTLVDMQSISGVFDSFCHYLSLKNKRSDYNRFYSDDYRTPYMDPFGCIPFYRSSGEKKLSDAVTLSPKSLENGLETLSCHYDRIRKKGATIYVSCACINVDALSAEEQAIIPQMDLLFSRTVDAMGSATCISRLEDYLFHNEDFYDTNYHLLSDAAGDNTSRWLKDLRTQMEKDGYLP